MARPPAKELTERELEVMHAFWNGGEGTAAEVRDRLAAAGLDRAYPTIANLVRVLYEKGLLELTNDQRPYCYRPARSFEEVSRNLVTDLLERVFAGSREQMFVRLLEQKKLTAKDRAALERILKEHDFFHVSHEENSDVTDHGWSAAFVPHAPRSRVRFSHRGGCGLDAPPAGSLAGRRAGRHPHRQQ